MRRTNWNEGWAVRRSHNRFAEIFGSSDEWRPVTLPHDAMIGSKRGPDGNPQTGYFPSGSWEYRATLTPPAADEGGTIVLEFEGAYRDAVVTVNGTFAAHRPYGYSNFLVPIDHLLRFGEENEVRVEVHARDDSRWYSGAGLYRNVWLLEAGPLHVAPDRLEVLTPEVDDLGAVVTVAAVVRNRSRSTSELALCAELFDPAGDIVAVVEAPVTTYPGDDLNVRQRLFVPEPKRWGPEHPALYECRVLLRDGAEVIDTERSTFGIRTLALDPARGLRVNGEPVLLRGACVHHDNGPIGAATIDRAEERRVEVLRDAGFNAIRSAHNPMSRAMLDACDRLGMLVMDETFDMWLQTKSHDDYSIRFADCWENDVEAMVRKDINHPCVIMYSIGNEIPEGSTSAGLHAGRALAEKVRALDDTRFVTQALSGLLVAGAAAFAEFQPEAAAAGTNDETGINSALTNLAEIMPAISRSGIVGEKIAESCSYLDVAGYNYMESRFEMDAELHPDRVIVASESHGPSADVTWFGVLHNPQVIGDFTWTGWDYLGEVGIGRVRYSMPSAKLGMDGFAAEYPWRAAWCGDIDITGRRRPQSYFREIVFGLRVEPYLAVHLPERRGQQALPSPWSFEDVEASWSWGGHEGAPVSVMVYADADEVELLLNGRSLGRQPVGADHRFRAEFECNYEPGVLEAVGWRNGAETGRTTLRSADGRVQLSVAADRAEISATSSDLAFVELSLVDELSVVHTTADRTITVTLDGPGELQGLGSADPCSEESFTGSACTTFRGRALAVIRPTGAGTIVFTATAEACDPVHVSIQARRDGRDVRP